MQQKKIDKVYNNIIEVAEYVKKELEAGVKMQDISDSQYLNELMAEVEEIGDEIE